MVCRLQTRLRFLVRASPAERDRLAALDSLKGVAKMLGARVSHPRWTSGGSIEFDVFAPSVVDFQLFTAALEPLAVVEHSRNLDEPPRFQPKERVVEEAVRYFNAERYWECHEALESIWRPARGKERLLLQGMILVCAAMVHVQRGEPDVALGIYKRALPQIMWDAESYHGVDVPRLRERVKESLARGEFPPFRI
jgi:hypothetical protein